MELLIIFIYIVLVLLIFLITKMLYRSIFQINVIFTILWCGVGLLSFVRIIPLRQVSFKIHGYILISIFVFNVIYFMFAKNYKIEVNNQYKVNYKLFYILSFIGIFLMFPYIIEAFRVILTSGFGNVRDVIYVSINEGSAITSMITRTLPNAIFSTVVLIAAIELAENKYTLLPIAMLDMFIYTITFGGRFMVLNFVIYYLTSYMILRKFNQIKVKKIYVFIGCIGLILITNMRTSNGMSVFEMAYLYFTGSLSYLQTIIDFPTRFGLETPMFGYMTFGFLIEPIVLLLKLFLNADIDVPSYYFNMYAQTWNNIGDNGYVMLYNNNTTMYYTFLLDFKEIGIVLGPALLSYLVCIFQNSYYKYGNARSLSILIYLSGVIFSSTISYSLTSITPMLIFIFLVIGIKRIPREC